ncbi:MAG: hypothetical protein AB7F59_13270 [Bdellovibrionales bacterium]
MLKGLIFLIFFLVWGVANAGSKSPVCGPKLGGSEPLQDSFKMNAKVRKELKEFPQTISVTRFNQIGRDRHTSTRMNWKRIGNRFQPDTGVDHHSTNVPEEIPLMQQQAYALRRMVETGYLTATDAKEYAGLIHNLIHEQITFVQSSHEVLENWILRNFEPYPRERVESAFSDYNHPDQRTFRTATMWSVAGQIWDPAERRMQPTSLPWQLEPAYHKISSNFDRQKYRYVWEWGRGAQDLAGEHEQLRHVLVALAYRELRSMGGSLDNAYVMFHSLDEANTKLYLKAYPDSVFPKGHSNPSNSLFMVPLTDLLMKYKPSELSAQFAALNKAFDGKLTEEELMTLHSGIQETYWQELNYRFEGKSEQMLPLLFADYSRGWAVILRRLAKSFRSEFVEAKLEEYMKIFRATYLFEGLGQYNDASDPQMLHPMLSPKNVVELSNLDPRLLTIDPQYPLKVLFSLVTYYARKISYPENTVERVRQSLAEIRGAKLRFAISTYDSALSEAIKKLSPAEVLSYQAPADPQDVASFKTQAVRPLESSMDWINTIYTKPIHVHIFDIEQIVELQKKHPKIFDDTFGTLFPGSWQTRWNLRMLDQF